MTFSAEDPGRKEGTRQLVERLDRLYTAVVSDALDEFGARENVMEPSLRPLYPDARVAGVAFPVRAAVVDRSPENPADNYRNELRAVDSLRADHVLMFSKTDRSIWGELLATAARFRGARGVVVDGYTRDAQSLIKMQFPTFVTGIQCQDSLGRVEVLEVDVSIRCGGVSVHPGDLVLADLDGVVVIPSKYAEGVIAWAETKVAGEDTVRKRLAEGMPVEDAFRTYHIL